MTQIEKTTDIAEQQAELELAVAELAFWLDFARWWREKYCGQEEPRIKDSGVRHKVKSGDSVWGITRRYKVKQADLLELNGIADPNKLRAGMELKIPVSN